MTEITSSFIGAVFYVRDGEDFIRLDAPNQIGFSGGDRPTFNWDTTDGTSYSGTGTKPVQSVNTEVFFAPQSRSGALIYRASELNTTLTFRVLTVLEERIFVATGGGNTAAIATGGVVTFAGTTVPPLSDPAYVPNLVLRRVGQGGAKDVIYVVDSKASNNALSVRLYDSSQSPPANVAITSDVTAFPEYEIRKAGLRKEFTARVINYGTPSIQTGQFGTTGANLQETSNAANWVIDFSERT